MIFILIEPVIRLFATTSSRSLSFLWLALISLSGCQSEHQKLLEEPNQIRSFTDSQAVVKAAPRQKSHLNTAVGVPYKQKQHNPQKHKLDRTEKPQSRGSVSQGIENSTADPKERRHNEIITKKIGVLLPLSQNSAAKARHSLMQFNWHFLRLLMTI